MSKSAAAIRDEQRQQFNAYLAECPSRKLLDRIADKWVSLAINALSDGPMRYSELARKLAGVSQKMLTQTLRALERDGIVERRLTPSVPVRTDYELTALGRTLLPLMAAIKTWSETHMRAVLEARADYDALSGGPGIAAPAVRERRDSHSGSRAEA